MTMTRRAMMKAAASAAWLAPGAFTIVPRSVLGGPGQTPPSEQIRIGLVGCGGRARQNLQGLLAAGDDGLRVVAVADPAETSDSRSLTIYRKLNGRRPMREAIEEHYRRQRGLDGYAVAEFDRIDGMLAADADLDGVVISTPDHHHARDALLALQAGKHVYCEKPLTHNLRESAALAAASERTTLATQMGNQGHSKPTQAETVERIRAGQLGEIREVHAWVPAKRWNPSLVEPPSEGMPQPSGLDWNTWIGPRQPRPFHTAYVPVHWRDFPDFGCGALGDFACHDLDSATWALDLHHPTTIEAYSAGKTSDGLFPHGSLCRFEFPATDARGPVRVFWYDGGLMPTLPKAAQPKIDEYRRGVLFVGDEASMLCKRAGGEPWVMPHRGAVPDAPPPTIRRVASHYADWLAAIRGGERPLSHFGYATRLNDITLLGVLAVRLGGRIDWDGAARRVTNRSDAQPILEGTYRDGWELPG